MKKILASLLLLQTTQSFASNLYEGFWNVRYADVVTLSDARVAVYVVWFDPNDWQKTSQEICDSSTSVNAVFGGSLKAYNQSHGDVVTAAMRDRTSEFFCTR